MTVKKKEHDVEIFYNLYSSFLGEPTNKSHQKMPRLQTDDKILNETYKSHRSRGNDIISKMIRVLTNVRTLNAENK